jgi:diguanylate cyclase (GGDEF)-like protein/PAS domain S-box-containing protein
VVGAVALTALVITRQIIAIRENGRLLSERAMHKSEARFRGLVQNSADLITLLGADGTILYQSPSFERLLGFELQTTFRSDIASMLHPDDLSKMELFFAKVISMPGGNVTTEMRVQRADGAWVNLEAIGSNLLEDPNIQGIVLNSRDITARNTLQEELRHQAYYEVLTGLPNRAFFMEQLQQASDQAARSSQGFTVMFLDLDNFKVINDSLGHRAGDNMLIALSKRLRGCVRPMDTVARLGGDEFTILLEGSADVSDATHLAERILDLFKKPFSIEGQTLFVSASIGIALSAPGADSPDDILRNADIALYQAKSKGKSRYAIFAAGMNTQAASRLRLETELRYAIEREEFVVYYQPVVDLKTGRISEVEALVRWQHPERGLVPPLEFIPIAEETGMIIPIGQWVLEQACRQLRAWQVQYPSDPPLALSVNLSARQFQHPHLVEDIIHTLHDCGLEPGCLKLEITESATMEDSQLAVETLGKLKSLGIQLAIDDFGTGYSTLSYLKLYPVDTLKIDRSFVQEIGRSPGDTAIVRAAIAFAKAMHLTVTAEGIETAGQLQQLQKQACDYGQGYYFSRPIPGQELSALLAVPPEWEPKNRASLPPATHSHGAAVAVPLLPDGTLAA